VIAALLVKLYGGPPPSADTPWLQPTDHYTGRCETSNGANVLMISPVDGARTLTPSPDDTWGVHLVDVNIGLGNLLTIVRAQSRAWLAGHRRLGVRLRPGSGRRLVATVTGPPGRSVRITLSRGKHRAARRHAAIGPRGRAVIRFEVRRPGRYRVTVRAADGERAVSSPVREDGR
jgi:hypothetical protein